LIEMAVRGHHVRGAFGGLVLSVALMLMLTLYGVVPLFATTGVWVTIVFTAGGLLLSFVAPKPRRRAPKPEPAPLVEEATSQVS
jgi:threonine/homoserine/homoserine lactone efflux protein